MIAWQLAKRWWDNNVTTESFEETLGWHLSNGVVYSTPHAFMMARECCWDGETVNHDGERNAWFIELAAGTGGADMFRRLMSVATRPHEWVLWHRHGSFERVKAYRWETLTKKIGGQ